MKWENYEKKAIFACKSSGKSDEYIARYLAYAKPLFEQDVPIIFNASHFSDLVGYDHSYVCSMAYSPKSFYRTFKIKKANGKDRRIDEPLPDLKEIQRWILHEILEKIPLHSTAKAYRPGMTIKDNAKFHRKQPKILTMDIKDFFPSIRIHNVFLIFQSLGYNKKVASFLAHLCCYKRNLPQGAPTSPYISNIRMKDFDYSVFQYAYARKIRYTRYADDLTFSGDFDVPRMIRFVDHELYNEGFQVNSKKTRVAHQNARQIVTGIVVNDHMQLPREVRRKIRQEVYYIKTYGLDSHLRRINETRSNYLRHLISLAGYGCFINPNDKELAGYVEYLKEVISEYFVESQTT